jgi:ATP-dependent Clp protease ATP-binding subunit ClpC
MTGIPLSEISSQEKQQLLNLEGKLHERVISQDEAIKLVAEAIRRSRVGLKSPNRPIASFLFLGPTGVGKTELAKALAELVFGDESVMIRLDMSEYMEKHAIAKLIGSPPGYVGYEEGGQLTEKIRRHPYSVILLDEIEKAHPDIFNILLQILDDGRLTDAKGRTVDFKNTIIIATSNIGSNVILEALSLEKNKVKTQNQVTESSLIKMRNEPLQPNILNGSRKWKDAQNKLNELLKQTFKPEFLNRIDEIITFKPLEPADLVSIVKLLLDKTRRLLKAQNMDMVVSDKAIEEIAKRGFDPQYGARPLRRIIQRLIENPISVGILENKYKTGSIIKVDYKFNDFSFEA